MKHVKCKINRHFPSYYSNQSPRLEGVGTEGFDAHERQLTAVEAVSLRRHCDAPSQPHSLRRQKYDISNCMIPSHRGETGLPALPIRGHHSPLRVQLNFLHLTEAGQDTSCVGRSDGENLQPFGMELVPRHAQ